MRLVYCFSYDWIWYAYIEVMGKVGVFFMLGEKYVTCEILFILKKKQLKFNFNLIYK